MATNASGKKDLSVMGQVGGGSQVQKVGNTTVELNTTDTKEAAAHKGAGTMVFPIRPKAIDVAASSGAKRGTVLSTVEVDTSLSPDATAQRPKWRYMEMDWMCLELMCDAPLGPSSGLLGIAYSPDPAQASPSEDDMLELIPRQTDSEYTTPRSHLYRELSSSFFFNPVFGTTMRYCNKAKSESVRLSSFGRIWLVVLTVPKEGTIMSWTMLIRANLRFHCPTVYTSTLISKRYIFFHFDKATSGGLLFTVNGQRMYVEVPITDFSTGVAGGDVFFTENVGFNARIVSAQYPEYSESSTFFTRSVACITYGRDVSGEVQRFAKIVFNGVWFVHTGIEDPNLDEEYFLKWMRKNGTRQGTMAIVDYVPSGSSAEPALTTISGVSEHDVTTAPVCTASVNPRSASAFTTKLTGGLLSLAGLLHGMMPPRKKVAAQRVTEEQFFRGSNAFGPGLRVRFSRENLMSDLQQEIVPPPLDDSSLLRRHDVLQRGLNSQTNPEQVSLPGSDDETESVFGARSSGHTATSAAQEQAELERFQEGERLGARLAAILSDDNESERSHDSVRTASGALRLDAPPSMQTSHIDGATPEFLRRRDV